jgi:hypothetical protein
MEKTLAGGDLEIPDHCDSKYKSLGQVWRAVEEMFIDSGKLGKRNHSKGNKSCFR